MPFDIAPYLKKDEPETSGGFDVSRYLSDGPKSGGFDVSAYMTPGSDKRVDFLASQDKSFQEDFAMKPAHKPFDVADYMPEPLPPGQSRLWGGMTTPEEQARVAGQQRTARGAVSESLDDLTRPETARTMQGGALASALGSDLAATTANLAKMPATLARGIGEQIGGFVKAMREGNLSDAGYIASNALAGLVPGQYAVKGMAAMLGDRKAQEELRGMEFMPALDLLAVAGIAKRFAGNEPPLPEKMAVPPQDQAVSRNLARTAPEMEAQLGESLRLADEIGNRPSLPEGQKAKTPEAFKAEMYHGSPSEIIGAIKSSPVARQFDNATSRLGAFFSPDESGAARYAGKSGKIVKVNVALDNPYEMSSSEFLRFQKPEKLSTGESTPFNESALKSRASELNAEATALREKLEAEGYDGIVVRKTNGEVMEVASFHDHSPTPAPKAKTTSPVVQTTSRVAETTPNVVTPEGPKAKTPEVVGSLELPKFDTPKAKAGTVRPVRVSERQVTEAVAKWEASGRVAFRHPKNGTISLNGGKAIPEADAVARINDWAMRQEPAKPVAAGRAKEAWEMTVKEYNALPTAYRGTGRGSKDVGLLFVSPDKATASFHVRGGELIEGKIIRPGRLLNDPEVQAEQGRKLSGEESFGLGSARVEHTNFERRSHEQIIRDAVRSGKPVPASVLADYPDLAAKYAKPVPGQTALADARGGAESGVVDPLVRQGLEAWAHNEIYWDGRNYRLKTEGKRIAPFSKALKDKYGTESTNALSRDAQQYKPSVITKTRSGAYERQAVPGATVAPASPKVSVEAPEQGGMGKIVSLRKAEGARIRKLIGLDDLDPHVRESFPEWWDQAARSGLADDALEIVQKADEAGRGLDPIEHAAAVQKLVQALDEQEMNPSAELTETIHTLTEAVDKSGTRLAQGLVARKMGANVETFELASTLETARKNKGAPLTKPEIAEFEARGKRIAQLQKQVEAERVKSEKFQAQRDKAVAERVARAEQTRAADPLKKAALKDKLAAERADLEKRLAAMGNTMNSVVGPPTESMYLMGKLAANYIKEGAASLDDVVAQIKKKFPNVEDRDVWEALQARSPEVQAKVASKVTRNIAEIKMQARLLTEIDNLVKGIAEPKKPGSRQVESATIRGLRAKLRELRRSAYQSNLPGERLGKAIETLNLLDDQLNNRYRLIRKAKTTTDIPDILQVREQASQLRRQMKAEDVLADLEEQKRTGEYKMPNRRKPYVSPELRDVQTLLHRERRLAAERAKTMKPRTGKDIALDIAQAPRAMIAGGDMSGIRQSAWQFLSHPINSGKAFGKATEAFFSKYKNEQIHSDIANFPNALEYERAKLQVQGRDETYNSTLAEKIPWLGEAYNAGNRHMTALGNIIRTSRFDKFLDDFPNATQAEKNAYASYLNKSTGIGDVSKIGEAGKDAANIFFSPKLAVSRVQTPLSVFKKKYYESPRVRAEMAKDFVKVVALGNTIIGLGVLAGGETSLDPDDPDWGKIRFGKTRIDIWGGFQQPARLVMKIAKSGLTRAQVLEKARGEQVEDWTEMFWRMLSYKFAPNITISRELQTGKTPVGEPISVPEIAIRSVAPLFGQDVWDAAKEEGLAAAVTTGALSYVGIGVQTYGDSEKQIRKDIREALDAGDKTKADSIKAEFNKANPKNPIKEVNDTRALTVQDIRRAIKDGDSDKARKIKEDWNKRHPTDRIE